jgi:membrane associated rhomboid family serine protease
MVEVPIVLGSDKTVHLDVCTSCHFVWFDAREFETLPRLPIKPAEIDTLSPRAKEALALARLEALKNDPTYRDTLTEGPDHWWEVAVAMAGVPVEYNDTPLRNRPVATWLLAAVIAVVSIAALSSLEAAIKGWGLIPAELGRHFGSTFITSFFLHAGLSHLIGNLYFLVVFGDNTEDVLGKRRFLLLVALAAIVGDLAHILADPGDTTPCVGASGGISGVLAYYCLRFPTAHVGIIWWLRWLRIPVWVMFLLWVLWQVSEAVLIPREIGGVAVFAHLGGALVGVLFWLWTRRSLSADISSLTARPAKAT